MMTTNCFLTYLMILTSGFKFNVLITLFKNACATCLTIKKIFECWWNHLGSVQYLTVGRALFHGEVGSEGVGVGW